MTTEINKEIAHIAQAMLDRKIDPVAGARRIARLRHSSIGLPADLLLPIVGFESETEDWVPQEQRERYSKVYLDRVDAEVAEYSREAAPSVHDACQQLVDAVRAQDGGP
jgi:hypothetical protein